MRVEGIEQIAVIGSGIMGNGIAQVAAMAGYQVTIEDVSQEILENAIINIDGNLSRFIKKEKMSKEDADEVLSRIKTTLDLKEAVSNADLVIEAVPEKIELKKRIIKKISEISPEHTILASNTSSISITEIATVSERPWKVIGMHFFNPPTLMKLVEIILGEKTDYETVEMVKKVAESMDKISVIAWKDSPGFIVNRILVPYLNESARVVYDGDASMEEIDSAIQDKANFPVGPFKLMDLIGLDIVYGILKVFEEKLGTHYGPTPSIVELFESGKLGRKSGEGFYDYSIRGKTTKREVDTDFDINILLSVIINEAARVVEEEIADERDVEKAIKYGLNLPEGPFEMLNRLGKDSIISTLHMLEKMRGGAYSPSPILSRL